MSAQARRVLDSALKLSHQEREVLAVILLDSVGEPADEVDAAWREEVRRRVADLRSGRVKAIPWAEVRRKVFAR
jgi:putative addiction module component (TIGR02574 family)